jgi:hypothetical protein
MIELKVMIELRRRSGFLFRLPGLFMARRHRTPLRLLYRTDARARRRG